MQTIDFNGSKWFVKDNEGISESFSQDIWKKWMLQSKPSGLMILANMQENLCEAAKVKLEETAGSFFVNKSKA